MTIAAHQLELNKELFRLAWWLEQQWTLLSQIPLKLQANFHRSELLILAEHKKEEIPDSQTVFNVIEQTIRTLPPIANVIEAMSTIIPDTGATDLTVRMYLRVAGERQPYQVQTFTVDVGSTHGLESEPPSSPFQSPPRLDDESRPIPTNSPSGLEMLDAFMAEIDDGIIPSSNQQPYDPNLPYQPSHHSEDQMFLDESFLNIDSPNLEPENDTEISQFFSIDSNAKSLPKSVKQPEPTSQVIEPPKRDAVPPAPPRSPSRRRSFPWIPVGVGVAIASVAATYVATRPCSFGDCSIIPDAQKIQGRVIEKLKSVKSPRDIIQAKTNLEQAISKLQEIPLWSNAHNPASPILEKYRQQLSDIELVVQALSQAGDAANKSQNAPHPIEHWRTLSQIWKGAIATLKNIPTDSPVYQYAQSKLKDYQVNQSMIEQRVALELLSQQRLEQGKKTGQEADIQSQTSKSEDSLQLARQNWQAAIAILSQIPSRTAVHGEAQQLLKTYRQKINGEPSEPNATQDGATLQGVNYSIGQVQNQLNDACAATPRMCTFTATTDLINVKLTSEFSGLITASRNDSTRQNQVKQQLEGLQSKLESISNTVKIPISVFNADNSLIGNHIPQPVSPSP